MRIALVHTRLLLRGGLETRLFSYMKFLQAAGHEVTVIVYRVGKGVEVPKGIRLIHIRLPFVPKIFKASFFDQRLGKLFAKEKFDFILSLGRTSHQDAVLLPGNHLGYLKAIGKNHQSLDDRLQIKMDKQAYAATGTILACSEMMRDEVVALYGADSRKIKVLYPPTDLKRFHLGLKAKQQQFQSDFGMDPEKTSIVLLSASHSRKGLPLLLQVFKQLENEPFELLVAGKEAVPTGLPNVRGLGFVKNTEELLAAADFAVLPALYEPYGQVVTESLLCGTPILVSEMVGAKSIVTEGNGHVLPDLEVETWLNAIRKLPFQKFEIDLAFIEKYKIDLEAHLDFILSCKS